MKSNEMLKKNFFFAKKSIDEIKKQYDFTMIYENVHMKKKIRDTNDVYHK